MNDLWDEAIVKAQRLLRESNIAGTERDWLERVAGGKVAGDVEVLQVLDLYDARARESALSGKELDYFDDD